MARIDIYNLSEGQNNQTSPLVIKDSEVELAVNYHGDNLGSLTKRTGSAKLIGQIVSNKSVLGMYFFKDIQGTDNSNVLVAINDATNTNSDIYKISADTWAISKADDIQSAQPVFATFLDYVFRANGSNVVNSSSDLTIWGTTNCPSLVKPRYLAVWEDRLYWANDRNSPAPSRIGWSNLPSGGAITWTAGDSGTADINPDDNDEITWLEPFGRVMLVFKNEAIYHWTFGQVEPDKIIDVGTPQGRTVKQMQGICFFLNKFGVWAHTGQGRPTLISKKVQPFIDAISDLTACRAEVDDDHYYLYIGTVTVDSETWTNAMLVYTISRKAWHLRTYPFDITAMARFKEKTLGNTQINDAIYAGDSNGFVFQLNTGNQDSNGTSNVAISGYIRGKEHGINFPKGGNLKHLYITSSQSQGARVNYRIDRGDWIGWGDLTKRVSDRRIAGFARTVQLSITDNSSIKASQIEGYTIEYEPKEQIRRKEE